MERKWTHVMFAVAGIVLAWLLAKCGEWAWVTITGSNRSGSGFFIGVVAVLIAAIATYIAWRNEQAFGFLNEVATELSKVSWPSRKETQAATVIVIVTVFIASAYLKLCDAVWSWFTGLIYG